MGNEGFLYNSFNRELMQSDRCVRRSLRGRPREREDSRLLESSQEHGWTQALKIDRNHGKGETLFLAVVSTGLEDHLNAKSLKGL